MKLSVKPSEKRQFRDRPGDFTCVGLQEIEVDVEAGPEQVRLYRNQGDWQPVEGIYDVMEQAAGGAAHAVLCRYGPMRGILIYGGQFGLNINGGGVPVIWTQDVDDVQPEVRARLGVDKFSKGETAPPVETAG